MQAIVQGNYGSADDLHLQEVAQPRPASDEVLVRVRASSVHADVWHVVTGLPYVLRLMGAGLRRPRNPVPGTEVAGVVEEVGAAVTRFAPGDAVFGETIAGMQWVHGGAFAQYATAPESALARKPDNVSFEQAAAVPTAALIALSNLEMAGGVSPGDRVLVNGGAGGVGSMAIQLAKASGAEVTAVDTTSKLDLLGELGADHVVDYTREDFTRGDARYDLVFDIPGNHPLAECRRALRPDGVYVLIGHDHYGAGMHRVVGAIPRMLGLVARAAFIRQLPRPGAKMPDRATSMTRLHDLLASGQLRPHIDRSYPLAEVPQALRYLQSGEVRGKIVITVD